MPRTGNLQDNYNSAIRDSGDRVREAAVDTIVSNPSSMPIPVTIESGSGNAEDVNEFNEKAIATSTTDTIATYTVPSGKELELSFVEYSGSNIAIYSVEINSTIEAKRRTWWNSGMGGVMLFDNLIVDENLVVELKVENFRPTTGNFEGRIVGVIDDK